MELIFIITIIILVYELSDKDKTIARLQKELRDIKNYYQINNTNYNYNNYNYNNGYYPNYNYPNYNYNYNYNNNNLKNNQQIKKPINENKMSDKEIKNSTILTTGAILIILASIIFLTSTWGTIHSFIKLSVIILMLFVFGGASYIADNILKIKQTAKVFFYIALTYFPLTLFSISWLGLLGSNLSLGGKDQLIYFSLSSIITALIYYFISKKKKNIPIYISSIIFQILSIVLLTLNFTHNLTILSIILMLYAFIVEICYMKNIATIDEKTNKIIATTIPLANIFMLVGPLLLIRFFRINNMGIDELILTVITAIQIFMLTIKINKCRDIFEIIFPLLITGISIIFANLNIFNFSLAVHQTIILVSFLPTMIIYLMDDLELELSAYFIISVSMVVLFFESLVFPSEALHPWIIAVVFTIFNLITYLVNDKDKYREIYLLVFLYASVFSSINIVSHFELSNIITLLIATGIFSLKLFDKKRNNLYVLAGIPTVIFSTLLVLFNEDFNYLLCILLIISATIALIYELKDNTVINKVFSYACIGASILALSVILNFEATFLYFIPVFVLIILALEFIFEELHNEESKYYILSGMIISSLLLIFKEEIASTLIVFVLGIISIMYKKHYQLKDIINIIPAALFAIGIYINHYYIKEVNINHIISFIAIITALSFPILKKKNEYWPIVGYGYLALHTISFNDNKYIQVLMFIIATGIYTYLADKKKRKPFISALYVFITILYNMLISDIGIDKYALFSKGYYLLLTLLFSRTIIKKDDKSDDYKIIEYFFFIAINIFTIGSYTSEFDGILFVSLLVLITIGAYLFKFGPAFICSIVFIIINALLLTRKFWLNIPWWIYILIIGSILIAFAIRNELNENNKKSLKKKIDKFKKDMDI